MLELICFNLPPEFLSKDKNNFLLEVEALKVKPDCRYFGLRAVSGEKKVVTLSEK